MTDLLHRVGECALGSQALPSAVIKIGIDPFIHLGPLQLAWHGLTVAIGIVVGGLVGSREAKRRGLDPEPLLTMASTA